MQNPSHLPKIPTSASLCINKQVLTEGALWGHTLRAPVVVPYIHHHPTTRDYNSVSREQKWIVLGTGLVNLSKINRTARTVRNRTLPNAANANQMRFVQSEAGVGIFGRMSGL